MNTSIQGITQASIEKITDVKEAVKIKEMADAAAIFYKAQDDLLASQQAKEISLRSARQAGKILDKVPKQNGGDRKSMVVRATVDLTEYQEALENAGISNFIAKSWRTLAHIPDDFFEQYLADVKYAHTEFSLYRLLELVKPLFRKQELEQDEIKSLRFDAKGYLGFEVDDIYIGDVREVELPENSVDMIFTDPPYDEESLPLFGNLAEFAKSSLKDGGYLMTYCGKMFLPRVMNMLGDKLEYVWEYGVFQPDSNHKINKFHIFQAWRPILCYKKPGKTNKMNWQPDMIKGTRDKTYHVWQQQIEPPLKWIEAYTRMGDLVVDPFIGGGTTAAACKMLKRHYIGFDIDEKAIKIAKMRLNETRI